MCVPQASTPSVSGAEMESQPVGLLTSAVFASPIRTTIVSSPSRARCASVQVIDSPDVLTTSWYSVPAVLAFSSANPFPSNAGTPRKPVPQSSISPSPSVVCQGGTAAAGSDA